MAIFFIKLASMKRVVISPESDANLDLLVQLAKQLNIKAVVLEGDEAEDFALGIAINEGKKSKVVSKKKILKALSE